MPTSDEAGLAPHIAATCRPVAAGEELTIDYTGGGVKPLWFDAR